MGCDMHLRKQLKPHVNFAGNLNTSTLSPPKLKLLKDYLVNEINDKTQLVDGAFTFIVDSGCACSCSPYPEDFEFLKDHPQP